MWGLGWKGRFECEMRIKLPISGMITESKNYLSPAGAAKFPAAHVEMAGGQFFS